MIDVMLKNIPGVVRSNKLRIIQLLEADLHQVLRIAFARNTTTLAQEHEGIISNHQYGRAHKMCMSQVLNKFITIQLLIQKKVNGIVFDNDTTGGVALSTLRRLGYFKESVRILGLLWDQKQYHICTIFGASKYTYGSSLEKIMYDIWQGSCASPILWALLNYIILVALEEKFDCIRLVTVDGVEEHIRPGDSFMDDTTYVAMNKYMTMEPITSSVNELSDIEETLASRMEEIIQFFLDLLKVSGGDLPPKKCAWFIITHHWKDGKTTLPLPKFSHRGIELHSNSTGKNNTSLTHKAQ
jgi:hypothetical protein